MISRYDRLMSLWCPEPSEAELRRQARLLETLTEWHKSGIDVESLYHVARDVRERYSVDIPPKATESSPKTNPDPT